MALASLPNCTALADVVTNVPYMPLLKGRHFVGQ